MVGVEQLTRGEASDGTAGSHWTGGGRWFTPPGVTGHPRMAPTAGWWRRQGAGLTAYPEQRRAGARASFRPFYVVMVRLCVVEGEGVAAEIASWVSYYAVGVVGVILGAVVLDEEVGGLDAVVVWRACGSGEPAHAKTNS